MGQTVSSISHDCCASATLFMPFPSSSRSLKVPPHPVLGLLNLTLSLKHRCSLGFRALATLHVDSPSFSILMGRRSHGHYAFTYFTTPGTTTPTPFCPECPEPTELSPTSILSSSKLNMIKLLGLTFQVRPPSPSRPLPHPLPQLLPPPCTSGLHLPFYLLHFIFLRLMGAG